MPPYMRLPLQLLLMILQRVQLVISAVLRQKLLMVPLLEDLAVGQHNNVVRVLDGGQPVRDDQHRADGPHLFQRILNQKLGLGVNIRRGFVQNHNAWLVDDRPRKAQQLALPGGEVVPALTDLLVQTVVQLVNELIGVDIAADL